MFLDEWKKIGKFHTRRFQQVKIFSLQISFFSCVCQPQPFVKNRFLSFFCIFVRWYLFFYLIPYKHKFLALQ